MGRRRGAAEALDAFFRAGSEAERYAAAPRVVEAVGQPRLAAILAGTRERIGPFEGVEERPDGLFARGPRGRVAVAGQVDDEGRLAALYVAGRPAARSPWRAAPALRAARVWSARVVWPLALVAAGATLWTAGSAGEWLGRAAVVGFLLVMAFGFKAPSATDLPRWARWAFAALTVASAASAVRLPGRPRGTVSLWGAVEWVLVAALAAVVASSRRARAAETVSSPLRLPLDPGVWWVMQGGGRWLNHHHVVPEQRWAVDLVKLGPDGTRAPGLRIDRDASTYAAYGTPLYAPCAGTVVRAADGWPDQAPGRVVFAPPAGNHVAIDTGREHVLLAHLRPGTVRVRVGDRVAVGDRLGEVGNSGNSTEPHLHLQADRDGRSVQLRFEGVRGRLRRGRRISVPG
ncbi:M23 family metallopeptidase [Streptomyces sp. NPDC088194]|uniref:M23 family metallopeptidase n=1 Tax=Streptomyces sp. NPDC088194 TaxID=3154931 RepID=UPI00344BAB35